MFRGLAFILHMVKSWKLKQGSNIVRIIYFLRSLIEIQEMDSWKNKVTGPDVIYDHLSSRNTQFVVISM